MVKKTRKNKKQIIKNIDEKLTKEKSFTLTPTEGGPTPKNKNQELLTILKNQISVICRLVSGFITCIFNTVFQDK